MESRRKENFSEASAVRKVNSGISSTLVLQRSTLLSSRQLSHACAPIAVKCFVRASAVIPVELRQPGASSLVLPCSVDPRGDGSSLIFFHEYGGRVGMVPRSSLKKKENNQMVEKRTKTTQQQTKQTKQSPPAESPPSCSLSSVLR